MTNTVVSRRKLTEDDFKNGGIKAVYVGSSKHFEKGRIYGVQYNYLEARVYTPKSLNPDFEKAINKYTPLSAWEVEA